MTAQISIHPKGGGRAEICLSLPAKDAARTAEIIRHLLKFDGQDAYWINEEGERLYSVEEVFPDSSPAMLLRGLRGKEDLTQKEFAERIGISQHHVSEMETGKRAITLEMAKRIGETFGVPYKMFL
ncbi:helix-turn-helix domain-containing protein [Desulfosarcina sp. OttesenSCG-928-A07]|nr:helix-turn-helix domain-containing protein [Desulfosarcina sp. OttesenSCG-928-G17]MDL2328560.1 helix-turn-helix domain-containing protein [Desulfosarcina sp. OttesenSCG-928-A07]